MYGVGYTYLESWIESIAYVRNVCAHYGRIYNAKLIKRPLLYRQFTEHGIKNDSIAGYSPYLQTVITLFMFLFGVNFTFFYYILIRRIRDAFKMEEVRWYFGCSGSHRIPRRNRVQLGQCCRLRPHPLYVHQ